MRRISKIVIDTFKRNGPRRLSVDENNNNVETKPISNGIELRKPRIFVDQVFEMAKSIEEFDEQSITDEIDTLIAGVWT